ncbi:hypothetical protein HELRODRAFT_190975 [Helobdella robusta]|uniref:WH2 domain-containing protein n=1 Tax=Helobdella robusta TaxID=6412 RepID=T1FSG9_HELRO|nr:hypothetical protein HELRODRAFT_190975 [Helobdella robusta]ESO07538.1 hypothetical protein HELRODRAFT_190975 [Helobdella robusta]
MPPPPPPPPGPPPPPSSTAPPKLSKSETNNRSALLGDICKGKALKKSSHLMVDKSKPVIGKEGGPNSSTSTIGPASGRGGKSNAPPGLADLFGGGVPRLKGAGGPQPPVQQPSRAPLQNGFRSNAPRPPGPPGPPRVRPPSVRPPSVNLSPPPPPPASAKFNYNQDSINLQESLTGRGANGRITGLGITSPPPPPPPNHQSSTLSGKNLLVRPALPNNKPMNIRAPPPPPVRSSENKMFPPPPPPPLSNTSHSSQDSLHRQGKNGLPRVPGGPPPPPPPVRSINPPPPPRQPSTSSELPSFHVPTKDPNLSG